MDGWINGTQGRRYARMAGNHGYLLPPRFINNEPGSKDQINRPLTGRTVKSNFKSDAVECLIEGTLEVLFAVTGR